MTHQQQLENDLETIKELFKNEEAIMDLHKILVKNPNITVSLISAYPVNGDVIISLLNLNNIKGPLVKCSGPTIFKAAAEVVQFYKEKTGPQLNLEL